MVIPNKNGKDSVEKTAGNDLIICASESRLFTDNNEKESMENAAGNTSLILPRNHGNTR